MAQIKKPKNFIDMTGKKIGRWTVIGLDEEETERHSYFDGQRMRRRTYWKCECSCEKKTIRSILGQNLRNGKSLSCGCWNKDRDRTYERPALQKDMTNQIINYIQVLRRSDNKKNGAIHWECKCLLCGSIFEVDGRNLRGENKIFSCGCIKSKGELLIGNILCENHMPFKKQYCFEDFPRRYFDFAVFNNDELQFLIEYDGEQHFNKNSAYYSEQGVKRDLEKNNYCLKNNIKLYRIPYWEYNNLIDYDSLKREEFLCIQ